MHTSRYFLIILNAQVPSSLMLLTWDWKVLYMQLSSLKIANRWWWRFLGSEEVRRWWLVARLTLWNKREQGQIHGGEWTAEKKSTTISSVIVADRKTHYLMWGFMIQWETDPIQVNKAGREKASTDAHFLFMNYFPHCVVTDAVLKAQHMGLYTPPPRLLSFT